MGNSLSHDRAVGKTLRVNDAVCFRPATELDVPRLHDIEVAAGGLFRSIGMAWVADDPPPDSDVLLGHVSTGTAWVAVDAHVVVGYVIASIVDGDGHVDQVSVDPTAVGRRIGERLIDLVDVWAAARGAPAITLTTFIDVPWNAPYYRRIGFIDLTDGELGPELRSIREAEREAGLDVAPRLAMRREVQALSRHT
jgi:ribosomal protein S18 acetylase RimI-like enzyme